ncbi:tetratricopeptide repeat protein [Nocardia shimofusensis]|uniref:tetratricopeptide repeat protein n=1 Tax=Nocardia shimofusensis TaxID=228596 RepID=UPI0008315DE3|nr:tetratricopeptide repeat protein [Nocardia shimofusensis]
MTEWPSQAFLLGIELLEAGRFAEAVAAFTLARTAAAGSPAADAECLHYIGLAHAQAGRLEQAATALITAQDLLAGSAPDEFRAEGAELTADILVDLGRVAESARYQRRAADDFGHLGDRDRQADNEYALACSLAETGDSAAAFAAFDAACRGFAATNRSDEIAATHTARADLAVRLDDTATARRHLEEAIPLLDADRHPDDLASSHYRLGRLIADEGDQARAEQHLRTARTGFAALDDYAAVAECDDALGDVLTAAGRYEDAVTALAAATGGYPLDRALDRADCHRRIGLIRLQQARIDQSLAAWARAHTELLAAGRPDLAAEMLIPSGMALEDIGRYDEALRMFRSARAAFAADGHAGEVAWCDLNIATVHLARGELDTAERLLTTASAILAGTDRGHHARAQLYLGVLHAEREDFDRAKTLLTAARADALELPDAQLAADCAVHLAGVLAHIGAYRPALRLLDQARASFVEGGEWAKVAQVQDVRGMCQFALGNLREAEELLLHACDGLARHGKTRHIALANCHLGLVYLETHRLSEARAAFERSHAALRGFAPDRLTAVVEANLAGLFLRQDKHRDAEQMYTAAEATLAAAGQPIRAAVCRQNRGGTRVLLGELDAAIADLEAARAIFEPHAAYRRNTAVCDLNIGLAHSARGDHDRALLHIGRARATNARMNLVLETARCDFLAATVRVARDPADLRTALDLALPALLFIDHQRLQFVHARTRSAWAARSALFRSTIFDWTARLGDPVLMAELVEVAVNSGTHTPGTADSPARADHLAALAADIAAGPQSGPNPLAGTDLLSPADPEARADAPAFATAGALVAGAVLPMRPPPRLRMPGGSIALGEFIDSAEARYGSIDRRFEVPAW